MARSKILLLSALFGALHGCATKAPPKSAAVHRESSADASVRVAVMPADSLLFADVASALDDQLGRARVAGARTTVRAKVSMEVAQLALECVSATDECYSQVGRYLQVDRLLWGQIARDSPSAGVKVTVVLLDVGRGTQLGRAEEVFPKSDAAIGGLRRLVDRASTSGAACGLGAALATGAYAVSARVCGRCRRPLPAPASEGGASAACPFCAAQDAGRAAARATQPRSSAVARDDAGAPKKRAEAFASALVENATRTTPVHSFAVPPEAIPVVNQPRRREPPPPPTPPPVALTPPPAPVVTILPPAAPSPQPPPAPPPRRAAAVTATLASLGPGPFTPQTRAAPAAAPAMTATVAVAAAPSAAPAASLAAAYAALPVAAPSVAPAPAPHLVPVPTPTPAPIMPAPSARVPQTAASLAETMLSLSPSLPESRREAPRAAPAELYEAPRAAAPAPSARPVDRGADAWNISSYIAGAEAPPAPNAVAEPAAAFAPAPGAIAEPQPAPGSEPVDLRIRGGLSVLLHRLPARGLGAAAIAALLVIAIGAGGFVLLGGPNHTGARKSGSAALSPKALVAAAAPRAAAAPPGPARLPSLVMPSMAAPAAPPPTLPAPRAEKIEKAEKPAKARAPEPEAAPPAVEAEAPIAPAPVRSHAHAEAKSKAVSRHAAHHVSAPSKRAPAHRRTIARASASEHASSDTDDSARMARARDAYREGNERLFSGDAAGAITAYEEMVRLSPKDPAGYRGLGLASAQLGKRTEAVRYLRMYLKHAPNADDRGIIISRISLLQTLPP